MASNSWEVVGKTKLNTKMQKRTMAEKMPKQDVSVEPLKISKSMFNAFEEKPKETQTGKKPLQDRSNNQSSPKGNKKPKKPKKQPLSSKYKYATLQEAINDVSVMAVYEKATQFRSRFPKNPNIWLKDIAAFLNDTISCPDESAAFTEKEFGYPLSKIPKPTYNMLHKLYVEEPNDVVKDILFEHFVKEMLDCIAADQPSWGYRLCIQALAHSSPKVCIANLHKDVQKIQNMKNVPKRCLAYLWALGQVGVKDPQCGMKVWLTVMLPMMQHKAIAGYCVNYLENLLNTTKDPMARLTGCVDADQFLQISKWTFDNSTGLAPSLRERLRDLYRPIRLFATGNAKLKALLFRKFLAASPEEIVSLKSELLEIVFECLQANPQCFSVWREMYMTTLPQTRVLLEYLEEKWVESLYKLPRKQFTDTICAFHNTNVDAATQSSSMTSLPDFKAVNEICKHMHEKLTEESRRTLSRCQHVVVPLLVAVFAIGLGLFVYDLHSHGGLLEKSATYRTLDDAGILVFMQQTWEKIATVLKQIMGWLETNIPFYWTKLKDSLSPYASYLVTSLFDFFAWLVEVTTPVREYLSEVAKATLVVLDRWFRIAMAASQETYEHVIRPGLLRLGTWVVETSKSAYSLLSGEIHWCCIRDAIVGYAVYAYEGICAAAALVWSYIVYVIKVAGDYISGENM